MATSAVQRRCEELAARGELVIMAGAGVSAGLPSAVPSWIPLNAAIFGALRARLEAGTERPGWLEDVEQSVGRARDAQRFPPDYQAQLIEEMCGRRYFEGLQALDIEHGNAAHEAIAALAAAGALRALVTTNFDRLIERAVQRRGVAFTPAFDEAGFVAAREPRNGALPVIKVHGCVSSPGSMVDTWKQRRRGRSQALTDCLAPLHDAFWVYAGFSAADLDDDDSYLGFIAGAARSPGAVYLRFPGNPDLGPGAQKLVSAYGERGDVPIVDVAEYLGDLGSAIDAPATSAVAADEALGRAEIDAGLARWAAALTVSAAGLCVAAILEGVGEGEAAVRVLDRLVRKDELREERDTPDFRALQLQYGRLGGALGRFVAVPDMQGAASNASVESVQSLLRIRDTEAGFLARAWLAPMDLWRGDGAEATACAAEIIDGFIRGSWDGPQPRTDEEVADAWACAAQVLVFDADGSTVRALDGTVHTAIDRARAAGDVVREARVAALHLLAIAATTADLPALTRSYGPVFDHARRVDDGLAFGLRALAVGRWLVDTGGHAQEGLAHLHDATSHFTALGMDPWLVFAEIQRIRALAQLNRVAELNERIDRLPPHIDRFPILRSCFYEAVAQMQRAFDDGDATANYAEAVDAALRSGLRRRQQQLSAVASP